MVAGGRDVQPAFGREPVFGGRAGTGVQHNGGLAAERGDFLGQLAGAARRLAQPERDGRGRAVRVLDPDDARLDPADPPRVRAEQEHVAGHRLDGPVLVDGADHGVVRLGQHPVIAQLRDGPAGGQRRDPGAAAAAQPARHPVPVQPGGAAAAAGADALGDQLGHVVEVFGGQVRERGRPAGQGQQLVLRPVRAPRTRRSCAGPGCPAARPARSARPAGPPAPRAAARRTPPARRGTSGTAGPPGCRSGCGWTGRPAAGTWRSCAATRSGRPARPGRCRCPAPGTRWRPGRAGRRPAAGPRPAAGGPWTGCRGAPRPGRRRAARRAGGPPARPSGGCSRTPAWCGARPHARRSCPGPGPSARWTPPRPARRRAARWPGPGRAGARNPRSRSAATRPVPTGPGPRRPAAGPPSRSAAGWRTGRPAAPPARPGDPAAPGSAPGASRACCPPPRGSRPRSPCSPGAAWPARGPR